MRRAWIIVIAGGALLALAANPASAGYGALAHDDESGKYGFSSNEESQGKADDVATKICGSDKCKVVFRTAAKQCGAIAIAEGSSVWGAGKGPAKAAAELDAITNCQKRTKSQCKVREWVCNK